MTTDNLSDEQLAQALVKEGIGICYSPVFYGLRGKPYTLTATGFVTNPHVMDAVMQKCDDLAIENTSEQCTVAVHVGMAIVSASDPNRSRAICLAYVKAMGEGK